MTRLAQHSNIIKMFDAYEDRDQTILILEYAEGGDLLEYIKRCHRLPEPEARSMFKDIISAVDFTHSHLLLHRDIKAENIFLDKALSPKLGDWGFAGSWAPGETQDIFCGSLHYSAPEICSGVNYVGPEVDIWSVGVLLYAMICGALPFSGETEWQIFEKIRIANFRLPPFVSSAAADLLLRLLQVNTNKRATMADIKRHPWVSGSAALTHISANSLSSRPIQTLSAPTLITNKKNGGGAGGFGLGRKIKERLQIYRQRGAQGKGSLPPILEDGQESSEEAGGESPQVVHFEENNSMDLAAFELQAMSPQRALSRGLDNQCRRKFSLGRLFMRLSSNDKVHTTENVATQNLSPEMKHKIRRGPPGSFGNEMEASTSIEAMKRTRGESDPAKVAAPSRFRRLSTMIGH
eukprot:TRINITY_DN15018_c0_g1_i1.p1 TRINITY_DN15018_c0_g1~~TRINITY_DN15018_c0_g1_i1.p1  ORF type:complete len:477 (+),score=76.98 TRINITY_DN15018_c0_g1_i1:211-1431(+)